MSDMITQYLLGNETAIVELKLAHIHTHQKTFQPPNLKSFYNSSSSSSVISLLRRNLFVVVILCWGSHVFVPLGEGGLSLLRLLRTTTVS